MNRIRRALLAALTMPAALTLAVAVVAPPAFGDATSTTNPAPSVTQTSPPPGSSAPPTSTAPPASSTPPTSSNPPDQQIGVVSIGAIDVRTGESLAGVTVALAGETMQRSAVTPASVDFAAGHVAATVTGVPDGYRLVSPGTMNGTLVADDTLPFVFHLTPGAVGRLSVVKIDRLTGKALPGATFEVRPCTGGLYVRTQTLGDGTFGIDELPVGCWDVVESVPPEGYLIDEAAHRIQVTADSDTTVTVYNLPADYHVTRNPGARIPLKSVPSGRLY